MTSANARKASSLKERGGFDRIAIIAERHEENLRRLHAGTFYADYTTFEVERLRLKRLLSQPLPPQLLPRQSPQQPRSGSRMTTDTGKMERGAQQPTVDDFSINFPIMPGTKSEKNFPSKMRAIGMREPDRRRTAFQD